MSDNGYKMGSKDGQVEEISMIPKAGWGSKGGKDEPEEDEMCGIGPCRPKALQVCSNIWTFTALCGLATLLTSSLKTYLNSQVMMLERQYKLSHTTTGVLVSCSDISFLVIVIFISYITRRWNIPRVLSISLAVFGIGALLCALSHAVTKNDLHPPPVVRENESLTMEKLQLKAPSCMVGNLPPETLELVMQRMLANKKPGPKDISEASPPDSTLTETEKVKVDNTEDANKSQENTSSSNTDGSSENAGAMTTAAPAGNSDNIQKSTVSPEMVSEGQTFLMPNFTKLAKHPKYEEFAQLALGFGIDLKSVAAMKHDEQVKYVLNLPPKIKKMLPGMKLMLGPDADSYFYPVPVPPSRRKRDVSHDLMHSGVLATMMKDMPPLDDSFIDEMFRQLCPFNTSDFMKSSDSAAVIVALIAIGMLLQGIARAPRLAFTSIYIDDNVEEAKVGFPLGIIFALGALGSAFAYGMGIVSATSYITLEDTGYLTVFNPRWLGAWWLGFLVYGLLALALAVPLMLFPKHLPSSNRPFKMQIKKAKSACSRLGKESKGLIQGVLRLMGNPVFLLLTLGNAVSVLAVVGIIAFLPKYMETQFSLPPFAAGLILSLVYFLAASLGTLIGGGVFTKAKLSPLNSVKLVAIVSSVLIVVQALALVFGCEQPELDMGNKIVGNVSTQLCSSTCVCAKQMYAPVCGSDGISYFSACHAGCGEGYDGKFHDCKCIDDNIKTAKPMMCEQPCDFLYAFCAIFVLGGLLLGFKAIPAFIATYRCVEAKDAPLAIGLNTFLTTLIGFIPSPVIFGSVIDSTCLLHRPACGFIGTCAYYDIVSFRLNVHGLSTGLTALAAMLYIGSLLLGLRNSSVFGQKIHDKEGRN